MRMRRRISAKFKANVALEPIKDHEALQVLNRKYYFEKIKASGLKGTELLEFGLSTTT